MNWTTILAAVIPSIITAIVTIITVISNNNKKYAEMKKDILELQEHVKEHNGYAKLFAEYSKEQAVISERVNWLCKRQENN